LLSILRPSLGHEAHDEEPVVPLLRLDVLERALAARGLSVTAVPAHDVHNEATSRMLADLFRKLVPDSNRELEPWLSPAFLLIVERPT
jgi:hypothetical protein